MKATTLYCLLFITVLGQNNTMPKIEKNSIKESFQSSYAFYLDPEEEIYARTNQMIARLGIDTLRSDPLVKGYCKMDSNQQDFILDWTLSNKRKPMRKYRREYLKDIYSIYDRIDIYPKTHTAISFIPYLGRVHKTIGYTFLDVDFPLLGSTNNSSLEASPKDTKDLSNKQLILQFAQNMLDAGKSKEEVFKAIQELPVVSSTKDKLRMKQKGNNTQLSLPFVIKYQELYLHAYTYKEKRPINLTEDSVKVGWSIALRFDR